MGWGYGKANEVPPAVEKAVKDGTRSLFSIHMEGTTIPHTVKGHFGEAQVILVPARAGHRRDRRPGRPPPSAKPAACAIF